MTRNWQKRGMENMCQIFVELAEKRANERVEKVREETRIETLSNSIKSLMQSDPSPPAWTTKTKGFYPILSFARFF